MWTNHLIFTLSLWTSRPSIPHPVPKKYQVSLLSLPFSRYPISHWVFFLLQVLYDVVWAPPAQQCASAACGHSPSPVALRSPAQPSGSAPGCTAGSRCFTHGSACTSAPLFQSVPPSLSPPSPTIILYIGISMPALEIGSSIPFSRSHMYALIYDMCLSLSDFLHSVRQTLGPSTSLLNLPNSPWLYLENITKIYLLSIHFTFLHSGVCCLLWGNDSITTSIIFFLCVILLAYPFDVMSHKLFFSKYIFEDMKNHVKPFTTALLLKGQRLRLHRRHLWTFTDPIHVFRALPPVKLCQH